MVQVREVKKSGTRQQWRKTEKPQPRPEQIPELGVSSDPGAEGRSCNSEVWSDELRPWSYELRPPRRIPRRSRPMEIPDDEPCGVRLLD